MKVDDWPSLFDVLDADPDFAEGVPSINRVLTDQGRGHIVLTGADEPDQLVGEPVAFADLGPVLHLWTGQGCLIGPQQARALADALRWWADRQEVA